MRRIAPGCNRRLKLTHVRDAPQMLLVSCAVSQMDYPATGVRLVVQVLPEIRLRDCGRPTRRERPRQADHLRAAMKCACSGDDHALGHNARMNIVIVGRSSMFTADVYARRPQRRMNIAVVGRRSSMFTLEVRDSGLAFLTPNPSCIIKHHVRDMARG